MSCFFRALEKYSKVAVTCSKFWKEVVTLNIDWTPFQSWCSLNQVLLTTDNILEKWFPLQGERAHSLYFWSFQKQNREEGETEQKQQTYQFAQGCNPNLYHTQYQHYINIPTYIY